MILLKSLIQEGLFSKPPPEDEEYNRKLGFDEIVKYVHSLPNIHKNSIKVDKLISKNKNYIRFVSFEPTSKETTTVYIVSTSDQFYVFFDKELVQKATYAFVIINFLSKNL